MLRKTTRKILQGKDPVRRKCDVKKFLAPIFRSFILYLRLMTREKNYVRGTMPV